MFKWLKKLYKRTKPDKPDQGNQAPPEGANCRCYIGIDLGQLKPRLESLGLSFQVGYDDHFRGSPGAWYLAFMPSYSWKGQTFGGDGAAVVKGIGLDVPSDVQYGIAEDGKITFYFQQRPDDFHIFAIIEEVERQVAATMKRYGETKAILAALKKK